ncbi:MAG: serine protease [Thermodesulfobacteriota bacterium]
MSSWTELVHSLEPVARDFRPQWFRERQQESLNIISQKRSHRNVVLYASAFLQKPQIASMSLLVSAEDINGFVSVMYGMQWDKGLTLLLHTPGGVINAAETLVEYLTTKFEEFETIIPTYAMSAGTMLSLASDRIIMGRQSQLGPIDPQMPIGHGAVSARAIVDQFDRAREDDLLDLRMAHIWAPILQSLGPGLLQEAQNELDYRRQMVARWLERRMFRSLPNGKETAEAVAEYFSDASTHKSHGRRIGREEARSQVRECRGSRNGPGVSGRGPDGLPSRHNRFRADPCHEIAREQSWPNVAQERVMRTHTTKWSLCCKAHVDGGQV